MCQFTRDFAIQLLRLLRIALAQVYVRQRCTVDHPIRLGILQQALDRARDQQVGLDGVEGSGIQPVAVRLTEDLVLFGCLERAVQAEQAAGSRDQDAAFPHSLPPNVHV